MRGGTDYEPLVQCGDETPSRQGMAALSLQALAPPA